MPLINRSYNKMEIRLVQLSSDLFMQVAQQIHVA